MMPVLAACQAFALPLAICLGAGAGWALLFGRPFAHALAPALTVQILIVLASGLLFHTLRAGIVAGILAIAVVTGLGVARNLHRPTGKAGVWHSGMIAFVVVYVALFVSDIGKGFLNWDEFAHWGMFVKDSLRLDDLYLASDLPYSHKDYVPAATLFEVMWACYAGGFRESWTYLALQVLMVSLMLPIAYAVPWSAPTRTESSGVFRRFAKPAALVALLAVPLFFNTAEGFFFYHSIYLDCFGGIAIGYCAFLVFCERESPWYRTLVLTLGLTLLVLTKMTLAAMYVAVLVLFSLTLAIRRGDASGMRKILMVGVAAGVPAASWISYNRAASRVPAFDQAAQSYSGMDLGTIANAAFFPNDAAIAYLPEVRTLFAEALVHRHVVLGAGYLPMLLAVSMAAFALAPATKGTDRRLALLSGIWILATGLGHAFMMYVLYVTSFTEAEALRLASYERYMNTFAMGAILLVVGMYVLAGVWNLYWRRGIGVVAVAAAALAIAHPEAFRQLVPGVEDAHASILGAQGDAIVDSTDANARIFVLTRGDDGRELVRLRYYGHPRHIEGKSFGPAWEDDAYSVDLDPAALVDALGDFDYLYVNRVDDAFLERYGSVLDADAQIANGTLFRVLPDGNGRLELSRVE